MTSLFDRYFSLDGRLARIPFFVRGIRLQIVIQLLFYLSIPFFSSGTKVGYRSGVLIVSVCVGMGCAGQLSLFLRRLHDLGLSGYHLIWITVAQIGAFPLSFRPLRVALVSLPLAAVGVWLLFWPGNEEANRFGEVPE